nr:MAG: hypothetical protein [Microviridae sp.]
MEIMEIHLSGFAQQTAVKPKARQLAISHLLDGNIAQ